jgi:hypothetical protein
MRIDQRNAGALVNLNPSAYTLFGLDRWVWNTDTGYDNKATSQQVTDAPAGFQNSLKTTVTSIVSPTSTSINTLEHRFEGYNVSDLGFGTANAKTVTISFWVNCSVTGNFGGALVNNSRNRVYTFSYTVLSANTWEQKTVTIPGDISGTWPITNGRCMILTFGLSVGSTYSNGTAGVWSSTYSVVPTGSINLWATNGATWQITGVQLEKGTTATSFDVRPYGTELQLCQRYFYKADPITIPCFATTTGRAIGTIAFPTTMRATPTSSGTDVTSMNNWYVANLAGVYSYETGGITVNGNGVGYFVASGTSYTTGTTYRPNGAPNTFSISYTAEI